VTIEELKAELRKIKGEEDEHGDPEGNHVLADTALLAYVNDPEVTQLFNSIERWYA
jgi:hypothetical protein